MIKKFLAICALSLMFTFKVVSSDVNPKVNIDGLSKIDQRQAEQISPEQPITSEETEKVLEENIKEKKELKKDDKVIFLFGEGKKNSVGFSLRNRTEAFYGRSLQLLSPSELDQVIYPQYTWDLKFDATFGKAIKSLLVFRHKSHWGNPNTIARTTEDPIKLADAVTGNHRHFLGKQIFWMREGWLDILLNEAFCFNSCTQHSLTLGAFSFKLGRGIALGDAYAVSPGLLGFYSNNIIDQYAPGILLHGDVCKDIVTYDLYLAILEDLIDTFANVNEEIYAMEIGKRRHPQRGFGKLNYVLASRLNFNWVCPTNKCRKFNAEPYFMYNFNPEQDVEFPSDASSKLYTFGFALEYADTHWEFGFDFAQNFGRQCVRPWDRNEIKVKRDPTTAALVLNYSKVSNDRPNGIPSAVTDANKKIVNNSPQGVALNGQRIGNSNLFNDINRFRNGYRNDYSGFMLVADGSYKYNENFSVSATAAIATGDEDPNVDLDDIRDSEVDGDYKGFIPLQANYSGKRVPSLFIVANNLLVRPLSVPSNQIPEDDRFAENVTDFSNLVFIGGGFEWNPTWCNKKMKINPNVLGYWQQQASKKFNCRLRRTIEELASKFLGVELNLITEAKLLPNLKGFFVLGVFFPGQHFKDITGKPLNKQQIEALKQANDTGFNRARTPLVGHHIAAIVNFGFEYIF